jgi:hypothetical protein
LAILFGAWLVSTGFECARSTEGSGDLSGFSDARAKIFQTFPTLFSDFYLEARRYS